MNDLELLPHMYAPLQLMFAEHCVEMELKAAQRARTKQRHSSPSLNRAGKVRSYSTTVDNVSTIDNTSIVTIDNNEKEDIRSIDNGVQQDNLKTIDNENTDNTVAIDNT